jgi:DNA invertase Pin-like site-specific DNA recombinase
MKMGYGRVSAKDQNPERQLVKFRELGIEDRFIFVDKQRGKDFDRPRYQAMRFYDPGRRSSLHRCPGPSG